MGLFPKSVKRAKILSIFINKDKHDITNYCPISILSAKFMNFFLLKTIIISLRIIYYLHLNLVLDQVQAQNTLY